MIFETLTLNIYPILLQEIDKNNLPTITQQSSNSLENFSNTKSTYSDIVESVDSLPKMFLTKPHVQMPDDDVSEIHDPNLDLEPMETNPSIAQSVATSPSPLHIFKILKMFYH